MKPKFIVIDVESTGLSPRKDQLHSVGISIDEDTHNCYPAWDLPEDVLELLADPEVDKVAHNARFDMKFLKWNKIAVRGKVYCTQALAYVLDENQSGKLENLALKYLGEDTYTWKKKYADYLRANGCNNMAQLHKIDLLDPAHPHFPQIAEYNCGDLSRTYKLFLIMKEKLKAADKTMKEVLGVKKGLVNFYLEEVVPFEALMLKMEMKGIRINLDRINSVQKEFAAKQILLETELQTKYASDIVRVEEGLYQAVLASKVTSKSKANVKRQNAKARTLFNWNSADHVGTIIFEHFKVPEDLIVRTKTEAYSTSAPYLVELAKQFDEESELTQFVTKYLEYQKVKKIASTYTGDAKRGILSKVETITGTPTIYTEYSQFLSTWRTSSSKPNMQNLPRSSPVKSFFRTHADDAIIFHIDASQIEFRVAAHYSQDPEMLRVFRDDEDPHRLLAAKVYGLNYNEIDKDDERRQTGKTCNFLLIFDGKEKRLQAELKLEKPGKPSIIKSEAECGAIRKGFFELYNRYQKYIYEQFDFVRMYHRVVCETGAVRRLPEIIYGNYLNYKKREFMGTSEMQIRAREYCLEKSQNPVPYSEQPYVGASMLFSHAKKQAINFPIQHLAAHIMKMGAMQLNKAGFLILHETHDSFDIELKISKAEQQIPKIIKILESCYPLSVPLKWDSKLLTSFDEKDKAEILNGQLLKTRR